MEALEKENSNDSTDKIKEKVRVVSLDDSTIIANSMAEFGSNSNASVWSLCGLNPEDHHVDLGDISPSISPIFTEQQMADHLTHRLMSEENIFSGEQATRSTENARPIPDLQTDLELFDREMQSMENLDSGGVLISKKAADVGGQLGTKDSHVVKRTTRKRGVNSSVDRDTAIASGRRATRPNQHASGVKSDQETTKDDRQKLDSKGERLTESDVEGQSKNKALNNSNETEKQTKNVDREASMNAEKEENIVPEKEDSLKEQNKTEIDGTLSPVSQSSTPAVSPAKRVTRSTTGNLKPKQKFDEIQAKYKKEEEKRGKRNESRKEGKRKGKKYNDKTSQKRKKQTGAKSDDDEIFDEASSDDDEIDFYEDDSDYSPEDDPDRPWCICRQPHGNKFMICCDGCEEWFHGKCVGITMEQGRLMEKQGKEYVCEKCRAEKKAKELLMAEKAKELAEAIKTNSRPDTTQEEQKKAKQQKRKPSSSDVVAEPDSSEKPGAKQVTAPSQSDDVKKKVKEPGAFRIPKKVRTTPTPVSHAHPQASKKCIVQGCPRTSFEGAVYCGRSCIERHVSEAVKMLSSKEHGGKLYTSEGNRVSMIEKSSGRLIAGMTAPVVTNLTEWILKNPSFQVLVSETSPTSHTTTSFYNKVNTDSKQKKENVKKGEVETVRSNVRRMMKDILVERKKESSEIHISVEEIMKLVSKIEDDMYKAFKDTSHRYKAKYRTLMFNLKDPRNKVLYRRVLTGDIPSEKLIWMTSDDLATKELAQWREQETKHMIDMIRKEEENTNKARLIKKTHKGEVDVDDEDMSTLEATNIKEEEEKKPKPEEKVEEPVVDTTEEHRAHLFDLNCKICTGKMAPPGEIVAKSPTMSSVPIQAAAESSIPSPPPVQDTFTEPSTESLSPDSHATPSDVLNSTEKGKEASVWKGFVMMPNVAKFGTNAFLVSGPGDNLIQVLPDTLHVHGRIAHKHVWEYVRQCKTSSSRELCIIRFAAATDEEKISYVSLYSYFHSRKRCGVIGNCYSGVKDMYLVPLASHDPVPPQLLPFNGPGLQEPRPHMLLGLIVKNKSGAGKRPRTGSDRPYKAQNLEPASKRTSVDDGTPKVSTPTPQPTPTNPNDSPVDEIEDIVFHYHNSQAMKPAPVKAPVIPPVITALLKIQEQEQKLRELQKQSALLEKELAPKVPPSTVPQSVVGQMGGVQTLRGSPSTLSPIALPRQVVGSQSGIGSKVSAIGSNIPAFSGTGVQSVVGTGLQLVPSTIGLAPSVGLPVPGSTDIASANTLTDDDEPYDPETADKEETPYDPEDLDLSLDEAPSPEKSTSTSTAVTTPTVLPHTINQILPGVTNASTLLKGVLGNTLGTADTGLSNTLHSLVTQVNTRPVAEISVKPGDTPQHSIPKELEEKVQSLLAPEILNQQDLKQTYTNQPASVTSTAVPSQVFAERLNRSELERLRIERDRGASRYARDYPDRRDFSERQPFQEGYDDHRSDPKFYSSRFSLRAGEDKEHDRSDHRSRDERDGRRWDERDRDDRHRDDYYGRSRDRYSRDRWRR